MLPSQYNWLIEEDGLSYDLKNVKVVYLKPIDKKICKSYFDGKLLKWLGVKQIHAYTNCDSREEEFASLFKELFKPSEVLNDLIYENLNKIGCSYVSITFRFQQLLGDFDEGGFEILPEVDQKKLVENCLRFVDSVKQDNPDVNRVLITSDSKSFLEEASKKYDYVYVIPGSVYHIGYTQKKQDLAYLKSFMDLYLISNASIVYNYSEGKMYPNSGFARLASLIGKREYVNVRRDY